ncbi:hypothetical protein HERIO_596 [Hepatospora eriocheir]|uniref:Uncharacterized protein n=1 Tax=Hepatospora eriocheir TaxID=1081669 RepID=A0A1X0QCW8_9MICR|nr:hypothetical protein HERIO_596 [Hepatospora eriocheir]
MILIIFLFLISSNETEETDLDEIVTTHPFENTRIRTLNFTENTISNLTLFQILASVYVFSVVIFGVFLISYFIKGQMIMPFGYKPPIFI